jgi:hypothetical protein
MHAPKASTDRPIMISQAIVFVTMRHSESECFGPAGFGVGETEGATDGELVGEVVGRLLIGARVGEPVEGWVEGE